MTHYYIFRTNHNTGVSCLVGNGVHNTAEECGLHWTAYMYGLMDGVNECSKDEDAEISFGEHKYSVRVKSTEKDVEYFMLLDREGKKFLETILTNKYGK